MVPIVDDSKEFQQSLAPHSMQAVDSLTLEAGSDTSENHVLVCMYVSVCPCSTLVAVLDPYSSCTTCKPGVMVNLTSLVSNW